MSKLNVGDRVTIQESTTIVKALWGKSGTVVQAKEIVSQVKLDEPVQTPISLIKEIWVDEKHLAC